MTHSDIINAYKKEFKSSGTLWNEFKGIFPNGVCHDLRNFPPFPFITQTASDIYLTDVDEHKIIDLWMGHYANILGHSKPEVTSALNDAMTKGLHMGTTNIYQLQLAKALQGAVPELEQLRFCTSGTEATMYALRVARAFTERDIIVKIEGGWHGGNSDLSYAVKPPFHKPSTEGLKSFPPTISLPINNIETTEKILASYQHKVAAIIMEPVLGAGGGIRATNEFVKLLRDYCDTTGTLLIFDETITAFRFRYGSIAPEFDVQPDLYTMGKIIGGGLHIGMYGGRADVMQTIETKQLIVGGGTFSANPLSMTAGLTVLNLLKDYDYNDLNTAGTEMIDFLKTLTKPISGIHATGHQSLFAIHFENKEIENQFKLLMLLNGVFTMHGGGALAFPHLTGNRLEEIKSAYTQSMEHLVHG